MGGLFSIYRGVYMKLKRRKKVLYYRYVDNKVSEHQLLTQFNPFFIERKIKACQQQINAMYDLNTSTTTCDEVRGVISVSYPIDKLAIYIIEEKEALRHYREQSEIDIKLLNEVLITYTEHDKNKVIKYMRSYGEYKPCDVIERLQVDLHQKYIKERVARQNEQHRVVNIERRNRIKQYLEQESVEADDNQKIRVYS